MAELESKFSNVNNVKFYSEVVNLGLWTLNKKWLAPKKTGVGFIKYSKVLLCTFSIMVRTSLMGYHAVG